MLFRSIPRVEESVFNTEDLLEACYPHNCSLLFRNRLFNRFPDFFFTLTGHDWCITVLNSLHGDIKVLPEVMGVWRMRAEGLWGGKPDSFHLRHSITFLNHMKSVLPQSLHKTISTQITKNTLSLSDAFLRERKIVEAQKSFNEISLLKSLGYFYSRKWLSLFARVKFPRAYRFLLNLRNLALKKSLAS